MTNNNRFTVKDFKPFDRVLVRVFNHGEWNADFFSHFETIIDINNREVNVYVCISGGKSECVPYNDETKYLLGTTQEYKGKYKTW